jgi:hypothetical protein
MQVGIKTLSLVGVRKKIKQLRHLLNLKRLLSRQKHHLNLLHLRFLRQKRLFLILRQKTQRKISRLVRTEAAIVAVVKRAIKITGGSQGVLIAAAVGVVVKRAIKITGGNQGRAATKGEAEGEMKKQIQNSLHVHLLLFWLNHGQRTKRAGT